MGAEQALKVYVEVFAVFDEEGRMLPRWITWEDGRRYRIDRVGEVKQAAAMRCGGQGDRFTVYIGGRPSYLYFERSARPTGNRLGKWFVERKVAAEGRTKG